MVKVFFVEHKIDLLQRFMLLKMKQRTRKSDKKLRKMGLRKRAMKYCSLQKTYAKNSDLGKTVGGGGGGLKYVSPCFATLSNNRVKLSNGKNIGAD